MYCDTSALLKLYFRELGSDELNRALEGRADLLVSDLAITELVSAVSRRLRQGALTRDAARRVHRAVVDALEARVFVRVELTQEIHRRAEQFLLTLMETPLRAADALHLAMATSMQAASIASFNARLSAAARAVGLLTYP